MWCLEIARVDDGVVMCAARQRVRRGGGQALRPAMRWMDDVCRSNKIKVFAFSKR